MTQSLRRRYQSDLLTLDAQKRTGEITRAQYDDARIRLAKEMAWRGLVLPARASNELEFTGQGRGVMVSSAKAPSYTKYMIVFGPATRFAPAKAILSRWSPDGWVTLKVYSTVAECKTYANGHHFETV